MSSTRNYEAEQRFRSENALAAAQSPEPDFARDRKLVSKTSGQCIDRFVVATLKANGSKIPSRLKRLEAETPSMSWQEVVRDAAQIENVRLRDSHEEYLYARGGMSATIPTEVADGVAKAEFYTQFEANTASLRSICVPGEAGTLSKELRPILDPSPAPTQHSRGGSAEMSTVRITRFERLLVGVFTQYAWVDEQGEIDFGPAGMAAVMASRARSVASLDNDLIVGAILGGVMADGEAFCNETAGNLVAAKPLNVQNVGGGFAAMRKQLADEKAILNENVVPDVLLVGSDSYFTSLAELEKLSQQPLRVVENPRFETGVRSHDVNDVIIAGAPAGSWWLLDSRRAIERTVLRGSTGPTVTQIRRNGEDGEWGVGWAIKHAVAATPLDRSCIRQFEAA